MKYKNLIIFKYLKSINIKVKINTQVQKIYDSEEEYESMLMKLQQYNLSQPSCFLASGQSCYFNDQIDQNGISSMKLDEETKDDCKFIASCFGKILNISNNNLPILYTTLLGTTELNYAMQTFPAGIFEDVFQCSITHEFPISPVVGEKESDYFIRVLNDKILQNKNFPLEKKDEVIYRAKRIISNFCSVDGKNRVYLIPFDAVTNNKSSFGDVPGLRDGNIQDINMSLNSLPTFIQLLKCFNINANSNAYFDPNMTSEFGIAIYGNITSNSISFFEAERKYILMQKKAKELGYLNGQTIPNDILYKTSKNIKSF